MIVRLGEARHDGRGHVIIQRWHDHDDGTTEEGVFVIPEDALEWRAAEYHLDPNDLPMLLEIVIAECYLVQETETPALFTAATVEEAREHHLELLKKVKKEHFPDKAGLSRNTPQTRNWDELFVMHPEAIELKKKIVARHREHLRRGTASREEAHDERMNQLRRHLTHLTEPPNTEEHHERRGSTDQPQPRRHSAQHVVEGGGIGGGVGDYAGPR